ncbi:hypothetical protein, partial [Streptomyces sp. McG7]|uniref:hypothetical protein n=1 Tax=Streptomyces sp. McG7 TaxID=2725486 RepID=UPI001BE66A36|nr:hypothetical protein [Streptomyces sp. McG7]
MLSEPRSGRLAAWGNALLAGLVSPDEAALAVVGEDAVRRCVGVAKCRTTSVSGSAVMCPSFRATGEEEHSTRGRARL